jgi:hypothetical protein
MRLRFVGIILPRQAAASTSALADRLTEWGLDQASRLPSTRWILHRDLGARTVIMEARDGE